MFEKQRFDLQASAAPEPRLVNVLALSCSGNGYSAKRGGGCDHTWESGRVKRVLPGCVSNTLNFLGTVKYPVFWGFCIQNMSVHPLDNHPARF